MVHKQRRRFMKICGSMLAMAATGHQHLTAHSTVFNPYNRVRLTRRGENVYPGDLPVGDTFIFHYPYATTPCMIMNLGKSVTDLVQLRMEDGQQYTWTGGIGPDKSVVSYAAICAHKMSYTAKQVSFINYRHHKVTFIDNNRERVERSQVIYCCSERSVYDPAKGSQVIGGPALQPLTTVLLEEDAADGSLYAVGTAGGELYQKFFEEFEYRLKLDFQTDSIKERVTGTTEIWPIEEFTETVVTC